jgi:hypothetical protein
MGRVVAGRAGTEPVRYRIVVRGELRPSPPTGPLEGLSVMIEDGFSVITGDIIDQQQLHGVLDWLGGRGIEIVSVTPADDPEDIQGTRS